MTLYEIDAEIMKCVDEDTGEVIDMERLNALNMERNTKIANVARWCKDLKAESEALKAEYKNLKARAEACDNKLESLKRWIGIALNGEAFKDSTVSISYRRSESVEFTDSFDINKLPEEYTKITKEPRKTEIKEALNNGAEIEGCYIETKKNVIIK